MTLPYDYNPLQNAGSTPTPTIKSYKEYDYLSWTFNFTKKGKTIITPMLDDEEIEINNGNMRIIPAEPKKDLIVKKKNDTGYERASTE